MYLLSFKEKKKKKGNSSLLLDELLRGASDTGAHVEELNVHELHINDSMEGVEERYFFDSLFGIIQ